jgi:hypothetical protein
MTSNFKTRGFNYHTESEGVNPSCNNRFRTVALILLHRSQILVLCYQHRGENVDFEKRENELDETRSQELRESELDRSSEFVLPKDS